MDSKSSFVYKSGADVNDYLDLAGGPHRQADKSSIYVLRSNGAVVSNRSGGFLSRAVYNVRLIPEDAIVVPEDIERTALLKDPKDRTQIFYQFALGAAASEVISNP